MVHGMMVHGLRTHLAVVHTTMVHLKQQWIGNTENLLIEGVHLQASSHIKLQYWEVLEDGNFQQEQNVTRSKLKH